MTDRHIVIRRHEPNPLTADVMEAFTVEVPTEDGRTCSVDVMHNLVRRTHEMEFSDELLRQAPEGVTAVVQLVMLAIRDEAGVPAGG